MKYRLGYNTTDSPLVVDEEGRVIGGHDWGAVQMGDQLADSLLEERTLVLVDVDLTEVSNERAVAAASFVDMLNERAAATKTLPKTRLRTAAREAGIVEEDENPTVAELRELVTEAVDVEIPNDNTKREA